MQATNGEIYFILVRITEPMLRYAVKMARTNLNVQTFPRPPALEKISRHVQIKYGEELIVDTKDAYWVLETHHPPSQYPTAWLRP